MYLPSEKRNQKHMIPNKDELLRLRQQYKRGVHIRLIEMNDPYRTMPPGLLGEVEFVDDAGTIFCRWENGSSLGLVYSVDKFEIVPENELPITVVFDVIESALALASYKILDGDGDTVIVRYAPTDTDYKITVTEIVP
jgi:hypothetical protein